MQLTLWNDQSNIFCELTGLAQSRVVRITPIKGVTELIFEVNLGKYSFASTVHCRLHQEYPDALTKEVYFQILI